MTTTAVSVTELKQNLAAMINQAAYGGQRIILLSHGKERAALISMDDLRLLEALQNENKRDIYRNRQLNLRGDARQLRESAGELDDKTDSTSSLEEVREERLDDLTDLR